MPFKNITIKKQLLVGSIFILLFVISLGVISHLQSNTIQNQLKNMYEHPVTIKRTISNIKNYVYFIDDDIKDLYLIDDKNKVEEINLYYKNIETEINVIRNVYLGKPEDVELLNESIIKWESIFKESLDKKNDIKSRDIIDTQLKIVLKNLSVIETFAQGKIDEFYNKSLEISYSLTKQLIIIVLIILVLILCINYIILDNVNSPLKKLLHTTNRYQEGELDTRIIHSYKNEFGELAESFNTMADTIQKNIIIKENRFHSLFQNMIEGVAIHEIIYDENNKAVDYKILTVNKSFEEYTGISIENATNALASELYGTGDAPYLDQYYRVASTGKPMMFDTHFEIMGKYFSISVFSYEKDNFVTVFQDVTNDYKLKKKLVDRNTEIQNYLYMASHDLKSPLVNIQGFGQRLESEIKDVKIILTDIQFNLDKKQNIDKIINEDIPKTLNFIFSNVTKMDNLLNGLLQLSRTGQVKMNIKKVNTNQLLNKIITSLDFIINKYSVNIKIDEVEDCFGDENQLNQVFSNIINNSIKYRKKDVPLNITISMKSNINSVIYSITDNGIGIAPKYLEKIWDVFYRVNPKYSESGDGIGLSLVKTIINKHNGKIWVESELGIGTTFYIELSKNDFVEENDFFE